MLLRLQKDKLRVKYKKGGQLFLADTLSRAYLPDVSACDFALSLQDVHHTASLTFSDDWLQQFQHLSVEDPVLQVLGKMIRRG